MSRLPKHNPKLVRSSAVSFPKETRAILSTVQADNRIYKRRLPLVGTITSDSIGRIKDTISFDPSTCPDWSSCSGLYDEFRVVGARLRLVPRTQNTVTLASNPLFVCFDNDDSSVITSYAQAAEYQNTHFIPVLWNNYHTATFNFARPSSGGETTLLWQDVVTPSGSMGAIKLYADTLTASTNYFAYMIEYAVEFRGIR